MRRMFLRQRGVLVCVALFLALFFLSGPVLSFDAGSVDFSADQIESFARVQNRIIQIQQEYNTQIAEAEDENQRQQVIEQANSEMIAAIEAEGLSIEDYNQILSEAQQNPDLMQEIESVIEENIY